MKHRIWVLVGLALLLSPIAQGAEETPLERAARQKREQAAPAVDTNVARVLTRAFHPRAGRRARDTAKLWSTAGALMPPALTISAKR